MTLISSDDFLRKSVEDSLRELLSPKELLPTIVNSRLSKYGIELTESQLSSLVEKMNDENGEVFTLTLTDEQEKKLAGEDIEVLLNLGDAADTLEQRMDELVLKSMQEVTDSVSRELANEWLTQLGDEVARIDEQNNQYLERLNKVWGEILDMFKGFIDICTNLGSDFNQVFRPTAAKEQDLIFEVLASSHAKCCQISGEIHTLLANGFPDGANARWRTLHEQTTIAMFVSEGGKDLANRYLLHAGISRYKRALQYNNHCKRLGFEPIPADQIDRLTETYNSLLDKFGENYKSDYGWASEHLKIKRPTFSQIEERRKADHFRPFINLSSLNVHGSSEGLYLRVGASPGDGVSLGAGRSYFGLADPLQNSVMALNAITINLLLSKLSLDRTAIAKALQQYTEKILEKLTEILDEHPELKFD